MAIETKPRSEKTFTHGFLAEASAQLSRALYDVANPLELKAGAVLFEKGDHGDSIFAVNHGRLEISVISNDGRKLALDVVRPGDLLGEIALFDQGPRTATVTALEDSRLSCIRSRDVYRAIARDPALARDMLRLAGRQLRRVNLQLHEQVFLPLGIRLARKLLHLTDHGGPAANRLEMSQSDLAEFVGATRESVSKTLAQWRRQGIIDVNRSSVVVHDRAALRLIADPEAI
ncbi:MAG: Crp/Fnr family transcriptional regulator [Pseudomonadota bacterium]